MSDVELKLSKDEALVLFEFLGRFSQQEILGIEDQSEARALWNLECALEKELSEPFREDYSNLVRNARAALRDEEGTDSDYEKERGRLALWLSPEDIAFLANEWRKIPESVTPEVSEAWSRVAFRAMSALRKSGISYEPEFPNEDQKYRTET